MTKRKPNQQRNPHNPQTDEPADNTARRSALDIFKDEPRRSIFKNAADVEEYLRAERESWDRPSINAIEEELKNRYTEEDED